MDLKKRSLFSRTFCMAILASLASVVASHAAGTADQKPVPIHIQAVRLDSYNEENKAIFSGDVVAKKAEMTIYADQMTVYYRKADKKDPEAGEGAEEVEKIFAKGHVKIIKGKRIATGDEAVYYSQEQNVILTGNPRAWEGTNMIKGDRITIFTAEDRSIVESQAGNRVEALVYPRK